MVAAVAGDLRRRHRQNAQLEPTFPRFDGVVPGRFHRRFLDEGRPLARWHRRHTHFHFPDDQGSLVKTRLSWIDAQVLTWPILT